MGQLLLIQPVMRFGAFAHARGGVRFLSSANKSFVISALWKRHRSRIVSALVLGMSAASTGLGGDRRRSSTSGSASSSGKGLRCAGAVPSDMAACRRGDGPSGRK